MNRVKFCAMALLVLVSTSALGDERATEVALRYWMAQAHRDWLTVAQLLAPRRLADFRQTALTVPPNPRLPAKYSRAEIEAMTDEQYFTRVSGQSFEPPYFTYAIRAVGQVQEVSSREVTVVLRLGVTSGYRLGDAPAFVSETTSSVTLGSIGRQWKVVAVTNDLEHLTLRLIDHAKLKATDDAIASIFDLENRLREEIMGRAIERLSSKEVARESTCKATVLYVSPSDALVSAAFGCDGTPDLGKELSKVLQQKEVLFPVSADAVGRVVRLHF